MATPPSKVFGASPAVAPALLHTTKLHEKQTALRRAWEDGELPKIAQDFLQAVETGVRATGKTTNARRTAISQITPKLADLLLGLQSRSGVEALTAKALVAAPQVSKDDLQALVTRGFLRAEFQEGLTQSFELPSAARRVAAVLSLLRSLPYEAVLLVLQAARNAAIDAMLKAWGESIRQNAELDAKNAKLNAQKAADINRVKNHDAEQARSVKAFSDKQNAVSRASNRLDPTAESFFDLLFQQRLTVLKKTKESLASLHAGGVDKSTRDEQSPVFIERSQGRAVRLADLVNVPTLDALEPPEEYIGANIGRKRDR